MIKGCDYYAGDGTPSLAGYEFAFIKATEGVGVVDSAYAAQMARLRSDGLVRGAYHFGWENESLTDQVDHFVDTAGLRAGEIAFLDFEGYSDNRNWSGLTWSQRDSWRLGWIAAVKKRLPGCRVGTYCDASTWRSLPSSDPGDFLFIAEYGVSRPTIEDPWLFWQYGDSPIDQDYADFTTTAALKDWAGDTQEDDMAPQWITGTIAPGTDPTVVLVPCGSAWSGYPNRTLHLGMDAVGSPKASAKIRVAAHNGTGWHDIGTHTIAADEANVDVDLAATDERVSLLIETSGEFGVSYAIETW